nr:MAG TPA: hypothetical protein [Caudoviricetes sp.]
MLYFLRRFYVKSLVTSNRPQSNCERFFIRST